MIYAAETKMDMWRDIADDPDALSDRNKTKEEAVILANYFEGQFDALCDAQHLCK